MYIFHTKCYFVTRCINVLLLVSCFLGTLQNEVAAIQSSPGHVFLYSGGDRQLNVNSLQAHLVTMIVLYIPAVFIKLNADSIGEMKA